LALDSYGGVTRSGTVARPSLRRRDPFRLVLPLANSALTEPPFGIHSKGPCVNRCPLIYQVREYCVTYKRGYKDFGELPTLRTKPWIIGVISLAAIGLALSLAGCGSGDSERQEGGSRSSSGERLRPIEPAFPRRSPNYGVAGGPSQGEIPPPADQGYGSPYPRNSSAQRDYAPYPSAGWRQPVPDQYNFRPLTERDKQRMRGGSGYPSFQRPRSEYDYAQTPPAPSWSASMYPQLERQGYSYWPLNPPGSDNAPQGPAWSPEREHVDQWGAPPRNPYTPSRPWSPPANRMLPNLDEDARRSFAAR